MTVRCCDNRNPRGDKASKKSRHNCRVRHIIHHHFVKAQHMRFVCQRGDDRWDWVALFLHTLGFEPGMGLKHKLMEMRTAFALHLNAVEKQVHQHRFTASNAAPKI